MRIAINNWSLVLSQDPGAKPLGLDGWNESNSMFSIKHESVDMPIIGMLHFPSDIATIINVLERYNTLEGVHHALVYEMVIEGMVGQNPEKHERCLNEPPATCAVCADTCPPEKCEEMKGGGS